MAPEVSEISERIPDALRPVVFLFVTLSVVIATYMAVGIQTVNVEGSCYTKTVTCHGFRVGSNGNKCLGWEVKNVDYMYRNSCDIEQLKRLCGRVKKAVCQNNPEEDWLSESIVSGRSCAEWNRVYNLGMKACQE